MSKFTHRYLHQEIYGIKHDSTNQNEGPELYKLILLVFWEKKDKTCFVFFLIIVFVYICSMSLNTSLCVATAHLTNELQLYLQHVNSAWECVIQCPLLQNRAESA